MPLTLTDISEPVRRTALAEFGQARRRDPFGEGQSSFYRTSGKRLFDVVTACLLLLALAPLLLILIGLVAMQGGRPIFAHKRVGEGGRLFPCLKVRSMRHGAEDELKALLANDPEAAQEWAESQKLTNDPRVTPFGRFLRQSSLDELPQLVNVLRGEMSIVGPRPITVDELARYGKSAADYLALKPGLTGPWQVDGRNDISYEDRVALDASYKQSIGFVSDVTIVLKTGLSVLKLTGR